MIQRKSRLAGHSAPRRALGVLVVFWLNLAAMPCTMALEAEAADSHCPPAAVEAASKHAHHDAQPAAEPLPNCLTVQSDCCAIDDITIDSRATIEKTGGDVAIVVAPAPSWPSLAVMVFSSHEPRPPDPDGHFPPIHVLNCVYLD